MGMAMGTGVGMGKERSARVCVGAVPMERRERGKVLEEWLATGDVVVVLCCPTSSASSAIPSSSPSQELEHGKQEAEAVGAERAEADTLPEKYAHRLLHLNCNAGKLGSRDLRKELRKLPKFIESIVTATADTDTTASNPTASGNGDSDASVPRTKGQVDSLSASIPISNIIIADTSSGHDIAIGVALAILSLYSDDDGHIDWSRNMSTSHTTLDKSVIRKRLSRITAAMPSAKPSRATLNAVNEFLLRG